MPALHTLKRRSEFQRVRGGGRWSAPAFLMEGKARAVAPSAGDSTQTAETAPDAAIRSRDARVAHVEPRFGFTVTKKLGNAVKRSRIRRRLKAAVAAKVTAHALSGFDYVLVARPPAFDRPFHLLLADMEAAFRVVNSPGGGQKPRGNDRRTSGERSQPPPAQTKRHR